jgi:hypothetical protein
LNPCRAAEKEKRLWAQYEHHSGDELVKHKELLGRGSDDGQVITKIQTERRERPYKLTRKAVTVSIVSAVAAAVSAAAVLTSALSQCAQTRDVLNQSRQPSPSIAPTPSPSP